MVFKLMPEDDKEPAMGIGEGLFQVEGKYVLRWDCAGMFKNSTEADVEQRGGSGVGEENSLGIF